MSDDTAGNRIESKNPRDAFTGEHQRMAWELAAIIIETCHAEVIAARKYDNPINYSALANAITCARLAQQIATGAL